MKILIVEDEPQMVEELEDLIKGYDEEIITAACSSPSEALEIFDRQDFDAAFLDIQMPEMTGLELADYLVEKKPDLILAFITAYNNYASEAFEVNAADYVLKPIRKDRFERTMSKICKELEEKQTGEAHPPSRVRIQAFGKITVSIGDSFFRWKRQKALEIFAYLLHQRTAPVHKETLCELMFPDYEPQKALNYLQTIMHQLRKNISQFAGNSIVIEFADSCYQLKLYEVDYDISNFLTAYEHALSQKNPPAEDLSEAEQCYSGPYFAEEGWIWAAGMQQNLALKYQKILEALIEIRMDQNRKEEVLYYIKKWIVSGFQDKADQYLNWIAQNIGPEEALDIENSLFEE